jgi:hypothetical protein
MIEVAIPENLMMLIHAHVVAAHTLAKAASEQPPETKGEPPKKLMDFVIHEALEHLAKMPDDQRHRVLMQTAQRLGEITQADSVTLNKERSHHQN